MSIDAISSSIASSYVAAQWAVPTVRISPQTDGYPEPVAPIAKAAPIDSADVSWSALAGEGAAVWPTWNPGRPYGLDPREAERRAALAVMDNAADVESGTMDSARAGGGGAVVDGAMGASANVPEASTASAVGEGGAASSNSLVERVTRTRESDAAATSATGSGMADGIGGVSRAYGGVSVFLGGRVDVVA